MQPDMKALVLLLFIVGAPFLAQHVEASPPPPPPECPIMNITGPCTAHDIETLIIHSDPWFNITHTSPGPITIAGVSDVTDPICGDSFNSTACVTHSDPWFNTTHTHP
jgi:hypothetical protein